MPGSFFDTDVLLYLASSDAAKAERAETLIGEGGAISVQVRPDPPPPAIPQTRIA
jgi:hypothetical protein